MFEEDLFNLHPCLVFINFSDVDNSCTGGVLWVQVESWLG